MSNNNISLGSGKIGISLKALSEMKRSTEKLTNEIVEKTAYVIGRAKIVADWASMEYGSTVSSQVRDVISQCNTMATASSAAYKELDGISKGLDQIIEGYLNMENRLVESINAELDQNSSFGNALYSPM